MDTSIKQKQPTFDYHQLLLSWFSPSFPIGSFNFSHGLEAAIEYGFVYDKISLEEWTKHLIVNGTGKTDSILLANTYYGEEVTRPIKAHVACKRYLSAVEEGYYEILSEASKISLEAQGGPFTKEEAEEFINQPFMKEAVELRRFDDQAKVLNKETPNLEHFKHYLEESLKN